MDKEYLIGIICYRPNEQKIYEIINKFHENRVVVFNNGGAEFIHSKYQTVTIIGKGINEGVASALNQIVDYAVKLGYKYLILSDQDTFYPENYFENMKPAFKYVNNVGAVFPAWVDLNSSSTAIKKQFVYSTCHLALKNMVGKYTIISHGITSGMIIDLKKVSHIDYDEALFIDWVDNEWCWRIFSQYNLKCVYNCDVTLVHQLGESVTNIVGIEFTARSPLRDYYIIRNAVYLFVHKKNLFSVKFYLLKKIIHHTIFSSIFSLRNNLGIKHVILAVKDALYLRMYKCPHQL